MWERKPNDFNIPADVTSSSPPPYEELHIDEFDPANFPTGSLVRPQKGQSISKKVLSIESTTTSVKGSLHSGNPKDEITEKFENDIFKKPPKFLLYPSKPHSENKSKENVNNDEFSELSNHLDKQSTMEKQYPTISPPPPEFPYPQAQPNANLGGSGVTLSPSELTLPQENPVQSTIVEDYMPRFSKRMTCPYCKELVNSSVQYVSGQMTHLVALAACWVLCCLACVPYFIDELKDAEHFCPQCRTILGYNRKKIF